MGRRRSLLAGVLVMAAACSPAAAHRTASPAATPTPDAPLLPTNTISGSGWSASDSATAVTLRIDRCAIDPTDGLAVANVTAQNKLSWAQDVMFEIDIASDDGAVEHTSGVVHDVGPGKKGKGGTSSRGPGLRHPTCRIVSVFGYGG